MTGRRRLRAGGRDARAGDTTVCGGGGGCSSNPVCDGNVLTNGAGRGLVIMDKATGVYR